MQKKKSAGVDEIAAEVAAQFPDATKKDVLAGVKATIEAMRAITKRGETVKIVGFGTFTRKDRPAGTAKNPKTKQIVDTAATSRMHFKGSGKVYA